MQTQLNPYIGFKDNAREAMEFYKTIFGGTLEIHTFKEFNASQDPSDDNKVMHAMLTGNGITFMAADSPSSLGYRPGSTISMSLSGDNEQELTTYFEKLSNGGTVQVPLEKAEWGDTFGMFTDKFGIQWLVNIIGPKS